MTLRAFRGRLPTLGERVYLDPSGIVVGDVTLGDGSRFPFVRRGETDGRKP